MSINVRRDCQDAFYRYKMPRLIAKVEGKGNGIKTVIPNMVDIARALGRPPTYPTKYFGCELGAQTQFDYKNDRYIVNGAHDAARLQELLYNFIDKFVLCENCLNPETVLKVMTKKGVISASCRACGHNYILDMRHKLTTFILKNPPDQSLNAHGTSLTERKERRSKRREQEKHDGNDGNENGNSAMDKNDNDEEDDDAEWTTDISKEAVKKRMKELSAGVMGLAMDDDLEKSEGERINIFHDFVMKTLNSSGGSLSVADDKAILAEAERLEIVNKAPIVLCELLLSDKVVAEIKKFKRTFIRFTNENQKAQKYLIGGIEKTIETKEEELLPKAAIIFKVLYDEDILDEEVLLEWGKKASKKYVSKELSEQIHKKAAPFITWLKEAEEESDEEDSDQDVQLEFDERAKITTIREKVDEPKTTNGSSKDGSNKLGVGDVGRTKKQGSGDPSEEEEDEEEDVDIDDI